MPDTENSLVETSGIPEIEQEIEICGVIQAPVDSTLSIPEQAADAKATGDWISAVEAAAEAAETALRIRVSAIEAWTGENLFVNSQSDETIAEAIAALKEAVLGDIFPVGSVITTTTAEPPSFSGTWSEIVMPLTWNDIRTGSRSFEAGAGTGNLHFWERTE